MLDALLGLAGTGISSWMQNSAANNRMKKMLRHLREVEAWQRNDRATAVGALQGAKQSYESDPRRAQTNAEWGKLMENPSALTDSVVSGIKANALSSNARNYAEGSRNIAANAQRSGVGNSRYAATLQAGLFRGANADAQNLSADIDTKAATQRMTDKKNVLSGYQGWLNEDSEKMYGFSRDLASLIGNTQYGNSLALGA